jgi:KUP system potassium uptake protein
VQCRELGHGFYQVIARYGFMETPDVPQVLRQLARPDADGRPVATKPASTTFYLGRETVIPSPRRREARAAPAAPAPGRMARWRQRLFIVMARNAQSATAFFNLPPNRVVELGAQIQF